MSRIPCEVMAADIGEMLAGRFSKECVVDVLEGTGLEQYSKQLGFGLYVVKGAVEPSLQEVSANGCDRMWRLGDSGDSGLVIWNPRAENV